MIFLNMREKYRGSLKPTDPATSATVYRRLRSRAQASLMRYFCRKSWGGQAEPGLKGAVQLAAAHPALGGHVTDPDVGCVIALDEPNRLLQVTLVPTAGACRSFRRISSAKNR